jgi:hypothetical protein
MSSDYFHNADAIAAVDDGYHVVVFFYSIVGL